MNKLDKYNTDTMKVGVIEEDGVAVVYVSRSDKGQVTSRSIAWLKMDKLDAWLDTELAHRFITNKIAQINWAYLMKKKTEAFVPLIEPKEYEEPKTYEGSRIKTFIHLKTQEVVTTSNVADFCRQMGMGYGSFKKMARGATKTSHGWALLID